jgi:hypothetical protein
MYRNKTGWYKIQNPHKFILPIDEHMQSFKNGHVNYKSGLELKAIRYADFNKFIKKWSLEPFAIKYIKPTDNKEHRYFIDFFFEFTTGEKFLIEVKSKKETFLPKPPKNPTQKGIRNYNKAMITYGINKSKWDAAHKFAYQNDMQFIILTEKELG